MCSLYVVQAPECGLTCWSASGNYDGQYINYILCQYINIEVNAMRLWRIEIGQLLVIRRHSYTVRIRKGEIRYGSL